VHHTLGNALVIEMGDLLPEVTGKFDGFICA
jgi:hypothetical protein